MHLLTDPTHHFSRKTRLAIPIHRINAKQLSENQMELDPASLNWAKATGFSAESGQVAMVPGETGKLKCVLFGMGNNDDSNGSERSMGHAKLARTLPGGKYVLVEGPGSQVGNTTLDHLAWALGGYSYDAYRKRSHDTPTLACKPHGEALRIAQGMFLARDLINTPANDMGPDALEKSFRKLGRVHGARVRGIKGDALIKANFPMVHAVGRASSQAPRVLDMVWGKASHPRVTLVGKGVTFDTGGLNIKPGASMALMKKDMGGAANVMGLAHMIMDAKLPVRLRLIVGAVENAISGNAFRPGDVLSSRKGITVEIGNTDAEGRLVLGDCLALGDEDKPRLMIDMATLTGAARVALGPELAPFYTDDDEFAEGLRDASNRMSDPVWRMPLWRPYQSMLSSGIADVNHIASGGFAGSVTAALFLSRFVEQAKTWVHFDIFGWAPTDKPWCVKGGEAQAIRALYEAIKEKSFG